MQFDLIIGNPPYQRSNDSKSTYSVALYHHFIEQAKQIKPKYLTMIIPARWFTSGNGLDKFREDMINDKRISHLVDYLNAGDVFKGVVIGGGVCYFVWDKDETDSNCKITTKRKDKPDTIKVRPLKTDGVDILIRNNDAITILNKLNNKKSFSSGVSGRVSFGFDTTYRGAKNKTAQNNIKLYRTKGVDYVSKNDIKKKHEWVSKYKVFISGAYTVPIVPPYQVINKPFVGLPNTVCTSTYFILGIYDDYETAYNVCTYVSTKFFRFITSLVKIDILNNKKSFQFVPLLDFTKPWTDEELYKMFNLDEKEIKLIESTIKPMVSNFKNPYEDKNEI